MNKMRVLILFLVLLIFKGFRFVHSQSYYHNGAVTNNKIAQQFSWSEWTAWGFCSRTCGTGIQKRERVCYDITNAGRKIPDYFCGDNNVEYKSCNVNRCSSNDVDFRLLQCQNFNSNPYKGHYYKWKPFLDGTNTCTLLCMPESYNFFQQLAEKVADGTSCGSDLNGICIDGECKRIGCDGILHSTKQFDKCGVCGGDNLSCKLISGLYIQNHIETGLYYTVTVIPRGAKFINITELDANSNYLSLKTEKGVDILNGDSNIEYSKVFNKLGTEIRYFRRRIVNYKDLGEGIFIKGPIDEPLVLQILYQSHNPGVVYHYAVDNDVAQLISSMNILSPYKDKNKNILNENDHYRGSNDQNTLLFTSNPIVTKQRNMNKNEKQNKLISNRQNIFGKSFKQSINSDEKNKASIKVTDLSRKTNENSYDEENVINENNKFFFSDTGSNINGNTDKYIWFFAGYTPCSASCGGGMKQKHVKCLNTLTGNVVHNNYCKSLLRAENSNITCNTHQCPPNWEVSTWSECSVSCGLGTHIRKIKCTQKMSSKIITELPHEKCENITRPNILKPCNKSCVYWKTSEWRNCQVTCGRGVRLRTVKCVNEKNVQMAEAYCKNEKPLTYEMCDMGSCSKVWFYSEWSSECSNKCQKSSYVTRKVVCGGDFNQNITQSSCDKKTMPRSEKKCSDASKCFGQWFAGPWSECSKTCSEGVRKRSVVCVETSNSNWRQIDDDSCDAKEKPLENESCNNRNCTSEWYMSDWSSCSKTCGDGIRTREIKCLDQKSQPSMECNNAQRPHIREFCNQRECPQAVQPVNNDDPSCKDTLTICHLIYKSNLCAYYKKNCCKTCK